MSVGGISMQKEIRKVNERFKKRFQEDEKQDLSRMEKTTGMRDYEEKKKMKKSVQDEFQCKKRFEKLLKG